MIPLIFAQTASVPSGDVLEKGFMFLMFLMLLADRIVGWYNKLTGRNPNANPQPFVVKEDQAAVSQKEFDRYREQERLEEREMAEKLSEEFDKLREQRSKSASSLYSHVRESIAGLRSDLNGELAKVHSTVMDAIKQTNSAVIEQGKKIAALEERTHKTSRA
jgi:Cu/Ag efflux pump CusA